MIECVWKAFPVLLFCVHSDTSGNSDTHVGEKLSWVNADRCQGDALFVFRARARPLCLGGGLVADSHGLRDVAPAWPCSSLDGPWSWPG